MYVDCSISLSHPYMNKLHVMVERAVSPSYWHAWKLGWELKDRNSRPYWRWHFWSNRQAHHSSGCAKKEKKKRWLWWSMERFAREWGSSHAWTNHYLARDKVVIDQPILFYREEKKEKTYHLNSISKQSKALWDRPWRSSTRHVPTGQVLNCIATDLGLWPSSEISFKSEWYIWPNLSSEIKTYNN